MVGKLDDPDLSRASPPADPESGGLEQSLVVRVHAVVAVVVLDSLAGAVELRGASLWNNGDRLLLSDDRAGERRDDKA